MVSLEPLVFLLMFILVIFSALGVVGFVLALINSQKIRKLQQEKTNKL